MKFKDLEREAETKNKEVGEATKAIAVVLEKEISDVEDPSVLVTQEIAKADDDLKDILNAVEQCNSRLGGMEDHLEGVKRVIAVLDLQKEIEDLSKTKVIAEYRKVEEARIAAHAFAERMDTIREAVQVVLRTTAEEKIKSTKKAISDIYRELAQRIDYPDIEIDPGKYEVMAVRDGESEVALRILNKGDINCAALSIFLALATSDECKHNIGFILLDDPSQCLDSPHKEKLAGILNRVLERKQLVIATSEEDFGAQLREKITKKKRIYTMEQWTEERGPEIKME